VGYAHDPHPRAEPRHRDLGAERNGVRVRVFLPLLHHPLEQETFTHRPERWEAPPSSATTIPGVWGHMLTFLGGPRSCIGFRFSLVESVFKPKDFSLLIKSNSLGLRR
jgi:hypothetical protein